MIGSLINRMGMADKLSVAQLQQAIQDGTLPAYVGIPMLQDKIQQEKAARAAAMGAQQPQQLPIAQQVMQEAQGIDAAQSNLPAEGFAGGGIVAFADGGMLDDEDDAEKEDKALFSRLLGGISMPKSYEESLAEKGYTPQGLRDLVRKTRKDDLGNYVAPAEGIAAAAPVAGRKLSMQGHPYHEQTLVLAKKVGVAPDEALKLLYTETGGVKDPARAKSKAGAYGPLQLMEPTAKELGVNRKNPIENIRGGLEYYKQQRDVFGDPKLAAAAYNAGPGAVRRALKSGYGIDSLPMETRQYAANFAGGGIVAFADGGDTSYDPMTGLAISGEDTYIPSPATRLPPTEFFMDPQWKRDIAKKEAAQILKEKPTAAKPAASAAPVSAAPTDQDFQQFDQAAALFEAEQKAKGQPTVSTEEAPDEGLADIRKMIKDSIAESKKQKEIDNWMTLLSGAFGTLQANNEIVPGKVHTALGSIGAGGQQAMGYAAQAAKQRADEQKGILAAQLGLSRAELYEKLRRDALKQKTEQDIAGTLAAQRIGLQGQALALKRGELMRKAAADWENSQDKADLVKDLSKRSKNWQQDSKLLGEYNLKKNRYMNQFVAGEDADNVLSASDLLNQ